MSSLRKLAPHLMRSFGIVLFIFVAWKFDIVKVLKNLSLVNPVALVLAIGGLMIVDLIHGIRWHYLLNSLHVKNRFITDLLTYIAGMFVGIVTPGRVGDFVKVLYLRREGVSASTALASSLIDRILDTVLMLVLGLVSLAWLGLYLHMDVSDFTYGFATLAALLAISVILLANRVTRLFLFSLLDRLIGVRRSKHLHEMIASLHREMKSLGAGTIAILFCFTFGWCSLYVFVVRFFCQAVGLDLPILDVAFVMTLSISSVILLPFSVAGIGTRDLLFLLVLPRLGYTKESAITISAIMLSIYVLTAFFGFISWLIKPVSLVMEE